MCRKPYDSIKREQIRETKRIAIECNGPYYPDDHVLERVPKSSEVLVVAGDSRSV